MDEQIKVLYEDDNIIVSIKPSGVLSEGNGMPLRLKKQCDTEYIFCVHRLDREASGVMVYAKNEKAAADLSAQITRRSMEKEYYAIVCGTPQEQGELEDLLFHDRAKNKTYVVQRSRKGVKKAQLSYELCKTLSNNGNTFSLVRIKLQTGRTHQIRVQFASRGMPLLGDRKYGGKAGEALALFSCLLKFELPGNHRPQSWTKQPEGEPWNLFFYRGETK